MTLKEDADQKIFDAVTRLRPQKSKFLKDVDGRIVAVDASHSETPARPMGPWDQNKKVA